MIVNGYEIKPGVLLRRANLREADLYGAVFWVACLRYTRGIKIISEHTNYTDNKTRGLNFTERR